jgi:hypothetical protein
VAEPFKDLMDSCFDKAKDRNSDSVMIKDIVGSINHKAHLFSQITKTEIHPCRNMFVRV